jgi:hypothetical protein
MKDLPPAGAEDTTLGRATHRPFLLPLLPVRVYSSVGIISKADTCNQYQERRTDLTTIIIRSARSFLLTATRKRSRVTCDGLS